MHLRRILAVLFAALLMLQLQVAPAAAGVEWIQVDGTDFAGDDIWFTEMYGATNGFPLADQTVGYDPVVGRALTMR